VSSIASSSSAPYPGDSPRSSFNGPDTATNALSSTHAADDASSVRKLQECLSSGVYEAHCNYILSYGTPSVRHLSTPREQFCAQAPARLTTIAVPQFDNIIPDLLPTMAISAAPPLGPTTNTAAAAAGAHPGSV